MVTDAEIQAILEQAESGVADATFEAYERAAVSYFAAVTTDQQIVFASNTGR